MAAPKLQDRLPFPEFNRMDDPGTLLLDGLARYRSRYDPHHTWPMSTEAFIHASPETEVPKLAQDVAMLAPENSFLGNPVNVRRLFNTLAFTNASVPRLAFVPLVEISTRVEAGPHPVI